MKKTFTIFTNHFEFCEFINSLAKRGRKFTATPWASQDGQESGFVVWYY